MRRKTVTDLSADQSMYTPLEYLIVKQKSKLEERDKIAEYLMKTAEEHNDQWLGIIAISIKCGEHLK
jgi:hypothetical protein